MPPRTTPLGPHGYHLDHAPLHRVPEGKGVAAVTECEQCARLAMQINVLEEVLRGVVIASRPGTPKDELDRAWRDARAIVSINEKRKDKDFVARLAEVRKRRSDG